MFVRPGTVKAGALITDEPDTRVVGVPSIEWVEGDRQWSRLYRTIFGSANLVAALTVIALVVSILRDLNVLGTELASPFWLAYSGGLVIATLIGSSLVLFLALFVFQTYRPARAVAPTHEGLAVRVSPLRTGIIRWTDIRWANATHLEWSQLIGTGHLVITPEQARQVDNWFRKPSRIQMTGPPDATSQDRA